MSAKEYEVLNRRCASLRYALQRIITTLALEDDSPRKEVEFVMDVCAKAIMADNKESETLKEEGGAE